MPFGFVFSIDALFKTRSEGMQKWFSYVMVNIVDHTHRKVNGKIHMPVIFTIIRIVKIE